jgi:hypothetical protein
LSRCDVGANRDLLAEEIAIAVLAALLLAHHIEPNRTSVGYERVPDALGGVAG